MQKNFAILKQKEITLHVYEHHKSREWLKDLPLTNDKYYNLHYDINKCAAKILYDAHISECKKFDDYEDLVTIVNDRDLWLNKQPLATSMAMLHRIYGDNAFIERFADNPSCVFTEREQTLLTYQKEQDKRSLEALLKRIEIKEDNTGLKYGVIYGEGNSSDVLNEAIRRFSLEYALLINLNTLRASIRSKGKFDCSQYAKQYNGGGHVGASGFIVSNFTQPVF